MCKSIAVSCCIIELPFGRVYSESVTSLRRDRTTQLFTVKSMPATCSHSSSRFYPWGYRLQMSLTNMKINMLIPYTIERECLCVHVCKKMFKLAAFAVLLSHLSPVSVFLPEGCPVP